MAFHSRKRLLLLNSGSSILYQMLTMISGFILPNCFIKYYGDDTYGVIASVTQYLQLITLCDLGFGVVVQSSLYKPIAQKNIDKISEIFVASKSFFNKIAYALIGYVIVLISTYPIMSAQKIDWKFSAVIIIAIAIKLLLQYFVSISYKLLLNASQYIYIQVTVCSATLIVNLFLSVILMGCGYGVETVLVASSAVFCLQPIIFKKLVFNIYPLKTDIIAPNNVIKQKWNGVLQHLATIVLEQSPIILLTMLTNFTTIAIYSIYHLVTNGIKLLFSTLLNSIVPLMGDIFVRKEDSLLRDFFSILCWLNNNLATLIFTIAAITIIPFIKTYTANLDNNGIYIYSALGYTMCIAYAIYSLRLPYNYLIQAVGHFRETQNSAFLEIIINLSISVILIIKYGVIGVPVAMSIALLFRLVYFIYYTHKYILKKALREVITCTLLNVLTCIVILMTTRFMKYEHVGYIQWIIFSTKVALVAFIEVVLINIIFCKKEILILCKFVKKR